MIYLDSCAIVKLIRPETESRSLSGWLNGHPDANIVTSVLAEVEVSRALRRFTPGKLAVMAGVFALLNRVEIDANVRATAAGYPDAQLRSLDAIHLATAETLVASGKTAIAFVTYDKRLAAAATAVGLRVVAPGV